MEERPLLEVLRQFWIDVVQPETIPNACILAGRLTHEVLVYFNINHTVQPVLGMAFNDLMYDLALPATERISPLPDGAWSVGVGRDAPAEGAGWNGHLVVITDEHFVDLSAEQFDRPHKGIITGGPMIVENSSFEFVDAPTFKMWHRPLPQGHYLWMPEKNTIYKTSKDWKINYKNYAGDLIRLIKESL